MQLKQCRCCNDAKIHQSKTNLATCLVYFLKFLGYNMIMLNIMVAPSTYSNHAEKIAKKIVKFLKTEHKEYSVYFFVNFADFNSTAKELTEQMETDFAVIGDDFVLNNFLNNVKDVSKIKLGIIPLSGEDDFAKYLDLSENPIQAIKTILNNKPEPVDYLIMNSSIVLNNIVIGASVELFEIYQKYKIKNLLTKKVASLKYANKFEEFEISIDTKQGKPKKEMIYELSIANGGLLNGKHLNPLANVKDGLFNISYSTGLEPNKRKTYVLQFDFGNQIYNEHTKQLWQNNVTIKRPENENIKVMADGKISTCDELNVLIVENGLKIFR